MYTLSTNTTALPLHNNAAPCFIYDLTTRPAIQPRKIQHHSRNGTTHCADSLTAETADRSTKTMTKDKAWITGTPYLSKAAIVTSPTANHNNKEKPILVDVCMFYKHALHWFVQRNVSIKIRPVPSCRLLLTLDLSPGLTGANIQHFLQWVKNPQDIMIAFAMTHCYQKEVHISELVFSGNFTSTAG